MPRFHATLNLAFKARDQQQAEGFAEAIADALRAALTPGFDAQLGVPGLGLLPTVLEIETDDIEEDD